MKSAIFSLLSLASSAAVAASQDREVPAFDSIHVASGIRAEVTIGSQKPVHIEAEQKVLELVEASVEDRTLHIGFKPNTHLENSGDVMVTVQTPQLRSVAGSGGAIVRASLTKADASELAASGGSELRVRGLDAKNLAAKASGGAILQVAGRAEKVELNLSGGSHFDGPQFEARDVDVKGSGGVVADLRATGSVRGGLSGGSEMHVRGGARASVRTSGGSEISVADR